MIYLQYANDITREPLLVMDEKLRVISTSRAFYQTFQVKAADTEGQFIFELDNRWLLRQLARIEEILIDSHHETLHASLASSDYF